MYPILFAIPLLDIPIGSFGVMMSIGFLAAFLITRNRLPQYGIDSRLAPAILLVTGTGGALGSKVYYATDMVVREGGSWVSYFSRPGGITWYGGLLGGFLFGWFVARIFGIRFALLLEATAIGLPVGQAIGRIGCFLAGDDYGIPTNALWAVAFPEGSPPTLDKVHPTQLYEMAWLLVAATILAQRQGKSPRLFAEYLVANGLGRFWVEFLRLNPIVAIGLTEPQLIAIGMMIGGGLWWNRSQTERESLPPSPNIDDIGRKMRPS